MLLIVGLGNPGKEYQSNRHNAGFMAVDVIVHRYNFSEFRKKDKGMRAEGQIDGQRVLALKPLTYMNLSGEAVRRVMTFYKIPVSDVVVFHEDMDIEFGKIKAKTGGGAGGHNGIKSIDACVGNGYKRVRIGTSHPQKGDVVDYVLGDFSKSDMEFLSGKFLKIADNIGLLLNDDYSKFIERVNKNGV